MNKRLASISSFADFISRDAPEISFIKHHGHYKTSDNKGLLELPIEVTKTFHNRKPLERIDAWLRSSRCLTEGEIYAVTTRNRTNLGSYPTRINLYSSDSRVRLQVFYGYIPTKPIPVSRITDTSLITVPPETCVTFGPMFSSVYPQILELAKHLIKNCNVVELRATVRHGGFMIGKPINQKPQSVSYYTVVEAEGVLYSIELEVSISETYFIE